MPDNDKAKEILAHASLFHDTYRFDDGLDVGHGARAAFITKITVSVMGCHIIRRLRW